MLMSHRGININTSNEHELFPQQNDIEPTDALMIQDLRHDPNQFMIYQGVNIDTYS